MIKFKRQRTKLPKDHSPIFAIGFKYVNFQRESSEKPENDYNLSVQILKLRLFALRRKTLTVKHVGDHVDTDGS